MADVTGALGVLLGGAAGVVLNGGSTTVSIQPRTSCGDVAHVPRVVRDYSQDRDPNEKGPATTHSQVSRTRGPFPCGPSVVLSR